VAASQISRTARLSAAAQHERSKRHPVTKGRVDAIGKIRATRCDSDIGRQRMTIGRQRMGRADERSNSTTPNGYYFGVATVTRTYLTDDLDGSDEDVNTVEFTLDGTSFEIDLSAANEQRLREKLARFVDAASPAKQPKAAPAKRSTKTASVASTKEQTQAIRDWAKAAGHAVSSRGRIAKTVQDAFAAAH
jgi:hypothetical protein